MFGQILATLYQDDIVEEDDIRKWHCNPESQGTNLGRGLAEKIHKCWVIGGRMIQQFDDEDSDEDDENE